MRTNQRRTAHAPRRARFSALHLYVLALLGTALPACDSAIAVHPINTKQADSVTLWHRGESSGAVLLLRLEATEPGSGQGIRRFVLAVDAPHVDVQSVLSGSVRCTSSGPLGFGTDPLKFYVTPSVGLTWGDVQWGNQLNITNLDILY